MQVQVFVFVHCNFHAGAVRNVHLANERPGTLGSYCAQHKGDISLSRKEYPFFFERLLETVYLERRMISGKSLFRKSPIQVEIESESPLWIEQPLTIRLKVHKTPDSLHSNDDLQSAWASSLPYLSANYSVTCEGHIVPVNHTTQGSTHLFNPNIILSVSEEEKEKYLLCLVYVTSISVDQQYLEKPLQLEVQLIYSNGEEGDAHIISTSSISSDMERNIRTLMDFNRQGKSLDSITYKSLHAPDRAVIRNVHGKFKLSHPLQVDIRCREVNQDTSIVSVTINNTTKNHVVSIQNVQVNLNQSTMDVERLWESILQTHKSFVQRLKNHIQETIVDSYEPHGDLDDTDIMSWENQLRHATWLQYDFNSSAMYLEDTFDTYSSIDGTSTIAPTQAPLLHRNHHHNSTHTHHHVHHTASQHSFAMENMQSLKNNDTFSSTTSHNTHSHSHNYSSSQSDAPRVLTLPSFSVTSLCTFLPFQLNPGEGKSFVFRVDRSSTSSSISTLDQLLTSFFPYMHTMLNISWQPGSHVLQQTNNSNTNKKKLQQHDNYTVAVSQHKVAWSLGAQCLPHVYESLFSSLYPLPSWSGTSLSLSVFAPLFEPRYHTEVIHRLHRMFLYGPALTTSSSSASSSSLISGFLSNQPNLSHAITSMFALIGQPGILHMSIEGTAVFPSTSMPKSSQQQQLTVLLQNPHKDLCLRNVVFFSDCDQLVGTAQQEQHYINRYLAKSSNRILSFHPAIVTVGDLTPFEKRAIVLTVERNIPSIVRNSSENEISSTSVATDTMASVFAEEFASILISQFAVEVTLLGASTGQNKRRRYRQVTPVEVLVSLAPYATGKSASSASVAGNDMGALTTVAL